LFGIIAQRIGAWESRVGWASVLADLEFFSSLFFTRSWHKITREILGMLRRVSQSVFWLEGMKSGRSS
jgi:hypothetical protein